MRPLADLTVVTLEHAVAGPFCTRQLADYGARVIKVERPGTGDLARGYDRSVNGLASYFVWLNRGKESVTLDVKQAGGRAALDRLVARADVVVQNLAPGAAARLGLGWEALAARNPGVIVADISGYGDGGPYEHKKAYDLLIQGEAGLVGVTGTAGEPSRCGVSIADIASGMYAYSGILTALLTRERTGRGTRVEISMLEALAEWTSQPVYYGHHGGTSPRRTGATHPTIAPYGPHRCGDGREVLFGLQNWSEWPTFCREVLKRPELATDPRFAGNTERVANRAELTPIIEQAFSTLTADEVVALLDRHGIANGRINGVGDVARHPQLRARGRWRSVGTSAGPMEALLPPANLGGVEPAMGDVPALGQHTDEVLRWLGYGPAEVAALRAQGAI
ncbi:MAG: CoA transferase [Deltaproteobacteria bacterium]|nr:CoA transferase [Deltaproteobacteria bacterium]